MATQDDLDQKMFVEAAKLQELMAAIDVARDKQQGYRQQIQTYRAALNGLQPEIDQLTNNLKVQSQAFVDARAAAIAGVPEMLATAAATALDATVVTA